MEGCGRGNVANVTKAIPPLQTAGAYLPAIMLHKVDLLASLGLIMRRGLRTYQVVVFGLFRFFDSHFSSHSSNVDSEAELSNLLQAPKQKRYGLDGFHGCEQKCGALITFPYYCVSNFPIDCCREAPLVPTYF